jgi:anti-sigma regulatory factor (Ser/Thr protein kinase)
MTNTLECEPLASSVRRARLFVVDKLQEWRCDALVDTVALLTSELATNAVVHTGQPFSIHVSRRGLVVRVEVADQDSVLPKRRQVLDLDAPPEEANDLFGRSRAVDRSFSGLGIVDRTASAWGSERTPDGKVVWFEVVASDDEAEHRPRVSDLRDLRDLDDESTEALALGIPLSGFGELDDPAPRHGKHAMTRDGRVVSVGRGWGAGRAVPVLLAVVAVIAIAVVAYLLAG